MSAEIPLSHVGLDEMLVTRWLARFMASSAQIGSFEFFLRAELTFLVGSLTSQLGSLMSQLAS
jgi:hypothetical protein